MTNIHPPSVEAYKHRYRGQIFRPKATAPYLVPSSSESEDDSLATKERWTTPATPTNSMEVELWRDEETRQADEDMLDSFQRVMDDLVRQAIRDIDAGNY
jgi:hypothetical protein